MRHPTFQYNDANRLSHVESAEGTADYAYNAIGELVERTAIDGQLDPTTRFLYDDSGHLLAEVDAATGENRSYVWLDDMPVAVLDTASTKYIETDHLNTPRAAIAPGTNEVVWSWPLLGLAFGEDQPDEDPDGDSESFNLNLRFPGQQYDSISGLHYNYFRDYEPATARYVQSDPIGLRGGVSTYGYSQQSPIGYSDPSGTSAFRRVLPLAGGAAVADGPAPIGELVAGGLLLGAIIWDACADQTEECFKRYDEEVARCDYWKGKGPKDDPNRWYRACVSRAENRRNLCFRNKGPTGEEPPEWSAFDLE